MTNTYHEPKATVALCIRLSPSTKEKLKELTQHWGLPMTAVVENLIVEAYEERFSPRSE